jgi:hypothetical protein
MSVVNYREQEPWSTHCERKIIDSHEQLGIIRTQFISIGKQSNRLSEEHILGAVVAATL